MPLNQTNTPSITELDGSLERFTKLFVARMSSTYPDLEHCRSMALKAWASCSLF